MDIDSFEIVAQFGYPYLSMLGCHGICGDSKGDIFICSIDAARPVGNVFKLIRVLS